MSEKHIGKVLQVIGPVLDIQFLSLIHIFSFRVPATFFMALIWALPPTRDTEMPGLTAGMTPEWNSSVSRKI